MRPPTATAAVSRSNKELAALRAAVGEHAIQLQSHTAAVRDLARSATDLRDAVADIGLLARNVADADGTLDHSKMAQGPNPAAGVARLAPETEPLPLAGWYHDLTGESTLRYWTANICSRTMSPRRPVVLRGAFRCAAMPSSVCEQDRVAWTERGEHPARSMSGDDGDPCPPVRRHGRDRRVRRCSAPPMPRAVGLMSGLRHRDGPGRPSIRLVRRTRPGRQMPPL